MGSNGGVDYSQLIEFANTLENFRDEIAMFQEDCAKELAARLLAKVIKRTPVGDYRGDEYLTKSGKTRHRNYKTVNFTTKTGKVASFKAKTHGKVGGDLRRGWTGGAKQNPKDFVESLLVAHIGDTYIIIVSNDVYYSSYVEDGHVTRDRTGWVKGRKMLAISIAELEKDATLILERKLDRFLNDIFERWLRIAIINDIIDGVVGAVDDVFSGDIEIYTEDMEQGLKLPCVFVDCLTKSNKRINGDRHVLETLFNVTYLPKGPKENNECYEVSELLEKALQIVVVNGDNVRTKQLKSEVKEKNLQIEFNVDMHFIEKNEEVKLGTIEVNTVIKR